MSWSVHIVRDISWAELETLQRRCVQTLPSESKKAHLLVSEPQATYTAGRSAPTEDLLYPPEKLRDTAIVKVDRGGKWTFHGPGQILLFPILRLQTFGFGPRSAKRFVDQLRRTVQFALLELGIRCSAGEHPFGLYVGMKKLASFGLAFHNGVSTHGVAIYYADQSRPFQGIRPCGQNTQATTSLQELGIRNSWLETTKQIVENVKKSFLPSPP